MTELIEILKKSKSREPLSKTIGISVTEKQARTYYDLMVDLDRKCLKAEFISLLRSEIFKIADNMLELLNKDKIAS